MLHEADRIPCLGQFHSTLILSHPGKWTWLLGPGAELSLLHGVRAEADEPGVAGQSLRVDPGP